MKFAAIFLACLVAAQAATFSCPSYDYWCSHNFLVYPANSYYCYTVPFQSSWCTGQYYSNCLVEFPKGSGATCEKEKTDVSACMKVYEDKLLKARDAIKEQLLKNKEAFLKQIDDMHALYTSTYERYLKSCAGLSAADLVARVKAYAEILKASRDQADKNYVAAVKSAIARIELFHGQILARFRSCITGRDAKINSYEGQLKCRIESMITRYHNQLKAIASRRHCFVVSIFHKLYAGTGHANTSTAKMVEYKKKLEDEVDLLVKEFRKKVEAVVAQLKESYRCNYKCYFQIGCRGFSRRSYSRSCVRFPSPPCYSYKLTGLCAFNADWNGCAYNCLRTCPAEQKVCVFDHDKYIKEVDAKKVQYEADLDKKVIEWTKQIEEWKKSALASLKSKISCLYPKSYCGVAPTPAQIEEYRKRCEAQAKLWIESQALTLTGQVTALKNKILNRISCWHSTAKAYVMRVKSQFDCCVANKKTKTCTYTSNLVAKIAAQKLQLENRLKCMADQHKLQYDRFHTCAFAVDTKYDILKSEYKECVDKKVQAVIKKFEDFWKKWQPKLEEHFICGYKCTARVTTPCLRLCYNWNFCAPSISYCKFY